MIFKRIFAFGILLCCSLQAHADFEAEDLAAGMDGFHRAALWAHVPGSQSWTAVTMKIIAARMPALEAAADKEYFCPGYSQSSTAQKQICWLRLVGGIVEFESSFQPTQPPFHEPGGGVSVGLLALSPGECPNAPSVRALMNPVQNLACGVNMMANLIARGRAIDNARFTGASRYWSTLRPAHKVWDRIRKRYLFLGKKREIAARTRSFRSF